MPSCFKVCLANSGGRYSADITEPSSVTVVQWEHEQRGRKLPVTEEEAGVHWDASYEPIWCENVVKYFSIHGALTSV